MFRLAEHDAARLPGSGRREQARKLGPVSHPEGMAALRENAPLALDAPTAAAVLDQPSCIVGSSALLPAGVASLELLWRMSASG